MNSCTFLLNQQHPSASGYYVIWETDGVSEEISPGYNRITLTEGQHLFLSQEQPGEEYEGSAMLIRIPVGNAFVQFCQEAERQAGQAVYDRIIGYSKGPRFGGGPYDYTNGFDGEWLRPFAVRIWKEADGECPKTLQEALSLVS